MLSQPSGPVTADRRPELDAIRLLVVLGLVFFHAALVFDTRDDFYVKNQQTTEATTVLAGLAVIWAMPMLFLIAGLGSWHSLRRRHVAGFVRARLLRLGVPLVVAVLTIVPVPPWLRLRSDPDYDESYWRFWPRFFDVRLSPGDFPFVLQGEHFETGHLWFVVLLLAFSLMLAAGVRWLPHAPVAAALDRCAAGVQRWRGAVLLPAIPLAAICAVLGLEEGFAGWNRWAYLVFFLCGFALAADRRFRTAMRRDAVGAAVAGVVVFVATMPAFMSDTDPFTSDAALAVAGRVGFGVAGWCWVVGILGLLDRRAHRGDRARDRDGGPAPGRVHGYLLEAALPIYVLHQPVVVAVAFHVVRWDQPMLVKYAAIVAASLALTLAAYHVIVRSTRGSRWVFGVPDPVGR